MFGYVRPLKGDLKVAEYEDFKAQYCGLCRVLGKRYGIIAKFALNYDLTFFSAALSGLEGKRTYSHHRCMASPFKKKCMCCESNASNLAADFTVILTYWKIDDSVQDSGFFKSLAMRAVKLFFKPSYKKAKKLRPELCENVKKSIKELAKLEKEKCDSIDKCSDTFAGMLSDAVNEFQCDDKQTRVLEQIFYHIGRWIYIVDACDDFTNDVKYGEYNPIQERYKIDENMENNTLEIPGSVKNEIEITLSHSIGTACRASELIDFGVSAGLVKNVLYQGLEFVTSNVLSGKWRQRRKMDGPL